MKTYNTLNVIETCTLDPDQENWPGIEFAERYWTAHIYKIVYVHEHPDNRYQPAYHAYGNWGMRVDPRIEFYTSLEAAMAACEAHSVAQAA